IVRPAMDDPVPDRDQVDLLRLAQPAADLEHGGGQVGDVLHRVILVDERLAVGAAGAQPRPHADAVHLAFDQAFEPAGAGRSEQLELDARRSRIGDEDRIHVRLLGDHAAGNAALRRRASANSTATAQEAMRLRTESAREVSTIGTRAPSTMPAESALASRLRFLASMLPASRSGTSRICARPATSDLMPLILTASGSTALSKASGPSRMPPVIWPRSAILHSAAASMVEGIFEVTVSTAERTATRGVPRPTWTHRSIAFWTMSRLASRSGKMLIAASVMNRVSG